MANINNLLNALDKVKSKGHNKWIACCPVHDDKTPSMAIREADGGRILVHCFGCGAGIDEIASACGIDIADFFPETDKAYKSEKRPFDSNTVLISLIKEISIVSLAATDIVNGKSLSTEDALRVKKAQTRIEAGLKYARSQ